MPHTKSTPDDMADDQSPTVQPNHHVNVTTALTKERELRPRSTEIDDMMARSRATPLPQPEPIGPVSERWLRQNLLPRLSRRPYETPHYFQQRMTTDAFTEDISTVPAHTTQSGSGRILELPSQLSDGEKICVSLNKGASVGNTSTALYEHRQHLMNPASEDSKKSPLQDAPVAFQTQNVSQILFEAPSPGSTVRDTEEEHKAAVKLCLGSYCSSPAKKRKASSAHERSYKCSRKRVCSIDLARAYSGELGAIDANPSDCENHGSRSGPPIPTKPHWKGLKSAHRPLDPRATTFRKHHQALF